MFSSILFEWPEIFDADFIAILTKADELLNCLVETLLAKSYDQGRHLGLFFHNYPDKLHTSHGILFLEDRRVISHQLIVPVVMRLHQGYTGMFKKRDVASN